MLRIPATDLIKEAKFFIVDTNKLVSLQEFIDNMYETMYNANGIGLAAPQIGYQSKILVVSVEISDGVIFKGTFINPKILDRFGPICIMEESCLSLLGIEAKVERHGSILLEYYDENWNKHNEFFHDMKSRVLQHEIDHLDGKLYIDLLDKETYLRIGMTSLIYKCKIIQKEIECKYPII
jgi:peptide deformylase